MRFLRPTIVYFLIAFSAGFVLGPIRVLVLEPRFGLTVAALIEAVPMLIVCVLAARFVLARWLWSQSRLTALGVGCAALALVITCELAMAPWVLSKDPRGWLVAFFAKFATTPGIIGAAIQLVFACLPALLPARLTSHRNGPGGS